MVCDRCKMVVKSELQKLGHHPISVDLGEVELSKDLCESEKLLVNDMLRQLGFSMIDDKIGLLIERIKTKFDVEDLPATLKSAGFSQTIQLNEHFAIIGFVLATKPNL